MVTKLFVEKKIYGKVKGMITKSFVQKKSYGRVKVKNDIWTFCQRLGASSL